MSREEGELPARGAVELLEKLYLRRATGVLLLHSGPRRDRISLLGGEIYLAAEDPLSALADPPAAEEDADRATRSAQMVERIAGWEKGQFELREGIAEIRSDVRGPLPTAALIMAAAVFGKDEFQLLRRLGGEDRSFVTTEAGRSSAGLPELDPGEAFLLSRMERPVQVKELLRQGEQERQAVLRRLCRLLAVGLILPEDRAVRLPETSVLTPELLDTFEEKIGDGLRREPLEMEREAHRALLGELIQRLGEISHYDLLGLDRSPTPEQVHDAYVELARKVHPGHAASIGLAGREAAMRLLFERATEAYLTLSDSERTRRYLTRLGGLPGGAAALSGEERMEERRGLADRNFRMARAMADREEYHFAIELLHQAIRGEERAEYYALLGDCQVRNPNWVAKAIANYGRAVDLDPDNPDHRVALARAYEQAGRPALAREQYRVALDRRPDHHQALEGLQRLQKPAGQQPGSANPLRRLLSWWKG